MSKSVQLLASSYQSKNDEVGISPLQLKKKRKKGTGWWWVKIK